MKILLTGATGQAGWELHRSLLPVGEIFSMSREQFDMARPDSLRPVIRELQPDIIVNAAAYTQVDKAEDEQELAVAINGRAPGVLAEEAYRCKSLLVHYSTDYVFDGKTSMPYSEDDFPRPLNVYGSSKLQGESEIQSTGCDYLILRTSWVYSARRNNFVKTMLRLFEEHRELNVVADQCGSPTWARFLADTTAQILPQVKQARDHGSFESGIYHLTTSGQTSWHGFASEILNQARQGNPGRYNRVAIINPVTSAEYPQVAQRPAYSCMSSEKLAQRFGIQIPGWQQCLQLCIDEIMGTGQAGME